VVQKAVAIAVSDLMFQPRIAAAAARLGLAPVVADGPEALARAMADPPQLLVVDLHDQQIDPVGAIEGAKAAGARVLAFGRHTDAAALRAARMAGADKVVPRSQLVEELPDLIAALIGAHSH
jgi:DNA-binding NarL/FixJ family response regulator